MPLLNGSSKAVIQRNTEELIHSGRPPDQAYAISMWKAGKSRKQKKEQKKGS